MQIATCLVNPRACYETELIFKESAAKKNIVVIGAGPVRFELYDLCRWPDEAVTSGPSLWYGNQIGGQLNDQNGSGQRVLWNYSLLSQ